MFNSIFQTSRSISNNSAAVQPIAKKICRVVAKMLATAPPNFVKKCYFFANLQDNYKECVFLGQSVDLNKSTLSNLEFTVNRVLCKVLHVRNSENLQYCLHM